MIKYLLLILFLMSSVNTVWAQYSNNYNRSHTRTSIYKSGIVINGESLDVEEAYLLVQILGFNLPKGNYYVDERGNFGIVGYYPSFNLVGLIQSRMKKQQEVISYNQKYQQNFSNRSWYPGGNTYVGGSGSDSYFFDSGSGCSVVGGELTC